MLQLYNLGLYFIDSLSTIGDWLTTEPLSGLSAAMSFLKYTGQLTWQSESLVDFVEDLEHLSLAGIIFGVGIISIIVIKVISFITDIVT